VVIGTRLPAALFMALVALRTGLSVERPGLGLTGAALALGTLALRSRPAAPTPGLSFIVLATGALLGYLALGELMPPASWAARYPLPGGVALAIVVLLLWVHAATPLPRANRVGEAPVQTLLVGGLPLLALLPLPPAAPALAPWLLPAGIAAAVAALLAGRAPVLARLAWAAPVLVLAPLLAQPLAQAPRPLVRLLWAMAPDRAADHTGYSPVQPLRALAFLMPSTRPVARVRLDGGVPRYLAGNRLRDLDGRTYTWSPAPVSPPGPGREEDGTTWHALAPGAPDWHAAVDLLGHDGTVFMPPGTLAVGAAQARVAAGQGGVLELRFADDARRSYRLRGRGDVVRDASVPGQWRALPAFWDAALDAQARALAGNGPAATAANIGAFLRTRGYALDTRLDPRRPFHDFFLRGKPAYCFWYATGAVLALRANGVPARVVSGYRVSERLRGDTYIVRERDAHAWAEWQDRDGSWQTLDPTPPAYDAFYAAHRPGAARRALDYGAAVWAALHGRLSLGTAGRNVLIAGGLAVLAVLFVREYRRIRAHPPARAAADARVTRLWRRFLRRARLPDEPAWTCARYRDALPAAWPQARRDAARAFLDAYGPARFGAAPEAFLPGLEAALRRFETAARQKG
jgi:transglutaminase-like putative cysteine protease